MFQVWAGEGMRWGGSVRVALGGVAALRLSGESRRAIQINNVSLYKRVRAEYMTSSPCGDYYPQLITPGTLVLPLLGMVMVVYCCASHL